MPEITFRRVTDLADGALPQFIAVYREAFGGSPYFETYTDAEIEKVWRDHVPHCLIVAEKNGTVVGLGCYYALPAGINPSVIVFLRGRDALPFPFERTVYMSEIAVATFHRRQGIGIRLIAERLRWAKRAGYTHFVTRTAESGSNSARLYERLGATRASFIQDIRQDPREVPSASNRRIFFYGPTTLGDSGTAP